MMLALLWLVLVDASHSGAIELPATVSLFPEKSELLLAWILIDRFYRELYGDRSSASSTQLRD